MKRKSYVKVTFHHPLKVVHSRFNHPQSSPSKIPSQPASTSHTSGQLQRPSQSLGAGTQRSSGANASFTAPTIWSSREVIASSEPPLFNHKLAASIERFDGVAVLLWHRLSTLYHRMTVLMLEVGQFVRGENSSEYAIKSDFDLAKG